jgi:hypothetical protein
MVNRREVAADRWYDRKTKLMEEWLGKEHGLVMHSIIPYSIGGGLDLYYFPNGIPGTAIATKELSELPGKGSSNRVFQSYELVMFTRRRINIDAVKNRRTAFGRAHAILNAALNRIAPYSENATLNPNETCEFPADMPIVGGRCLIFNAYPTCPEEQVKFGLLALIEVFRTEMDYARKHGGAKLLKKLKSKGHYPYSDMDRDPVV